MRFGSLFSGMGGFDLGMERAGMQCAWQCEIDPQAQRVLRARFPSVPLYSDVAALNGAEIEPVDVITFGSPCQDLSVAGQRGGFADGTRSSLFFEAVRIMREMREATNDRFPNVALWENVPGAKSSSQGRDFGTALDALAGCGAVDIAWRIINAEHWTPQRRRRVFVVALFPPFAPGDSGAGRAGEILALSESLPRHVTARRTLGQDLAGTIGGGSGSRGWSDDTDRMTFVPEQAETLTARHAGDPAHGGKDSTVRNDVAYGAPAAFDPANITSKANRSRVEPDAPSPTLHQGGMSVAYPLYQPVDRADKVGNDGDPMYTLQQAHQHGVAYSLQGAGATSQRSQGSGWKEEGMFTLNLTDVHGDAVNVPVIGFNWQDSGGPAAIADGRTTVRNGSEPAVAYRWRVRRLTPLECVRLMGFPDDWLDGLKLSDAVKYRLCGNAVLPQKTEWIARRILEAEKGVVGHAAMIGQKESLGSVQECRGQQPWDGYPDDSTALADRARTGTMTETVVNLEDAEAVVRSAYHALGDVCDITSARDILWQPLNDYPIVPADVPIAIADVKHLRGQLAIVLAGLEAIRDRLPDPAQTTAEEATR